jgi:nitrogen fixation protein FixH
MNWGTKIAIVYSSFVAFMLFMVYKAMSQKVDLISEDYYAKELLYEDRIQANKNSQALSAMPTLRAAADKTLILKMPNELKGKNIVGEINFFCPSNDKLDKKIPLSVDTSGIQIIAPHSIEQGRYRVQTTWQTDGLNYFSENILIY